MLRYLGHGERRYGLYPLQSRPRLNWEIFALVRGRCAPVFDGEPEQALRRNTLWIFPPGSAHGWRGETRRRAIVAIFHFGALPPPLETEVRARRHLELPLPVAESRRLLALARRLQADFDQPTRLSNLLFQSAQLELSLLALSKLPEQREPLPAGHAERTVTAAIQWYGEHLRENPPITAVARQVHVAPSTLRRLFHQTRKESPARVFEHLRIDAAIQLMTRTRLKLDAIAEECGYGSTSDFCRAFKALTKVTPNVWRRTILPPPLSATSPAAASDGTALDRPPGRGARRGSPAC